MSKVIKITETELKNVIENIIKEGQGERRFRSSIYVDIFVPETDDIEKDREEAQKIAEEISNNIDYNSYVGGTAHWERHGSLTIPDEELNRL